MKRTQRAWTASVLNMILMFSMIACAQGSARSAVEGATSHSSRGRASSPPTSGCAHPGCADEESEVPSQGTCCLSWAPPLLPVTLAPPVLFADARGLVLFAAGIDATLGISAKSARPAWSFPPGETQPLQPLLGSSLLGRAPPLA